MTQHTFGGLWTKRKLDILREYIDFYVNALKNTQFKLVYIDAFAGTGRCTIKVRGGMSQEIRGSAWLALDAKPSFASVHFIESKQKHVRELRKLLVEHPSGHLGEVIPGKAQHHLQQVLDKHNWRETRGVLFLDPYGLQCDWDTVQRIAATKALDVFFLVSLSGLYRQATNNLKDAESDKRERLSTFLGTSGWAEALYKKQGTFFDEQDDHVRHADPAAFAKYVKERLEEVFPKVIDPVILHQETASGKQGAPLYALFFAVSNPARRATDLATKVSKQIMSKLRLQP